MNRHRLTLIIAAVAIIATWLTVGAQQYPRRLPRQQPQRVAPNVARPKSPVVAAAVIATPGGEGGEHYAPNLGIYYQLVPYPPNGGGNQQALIVTPDPNQSYGAKLTRYPVPGSPADVLQLEPKDIIISLDDLPIQTPNDLLVHQYQTSVVIVNVRTGFPQTANVYIP